MSTSFDSPPPQVSNSTDDCILSVKDRAISTVLTAFVGSIVSGMTNGPTLAFIVAWICWLAVVRLVLVSGAGVLVNLFGPLDVRGLAFIPPSRWRNAEDVTILGSIGWIYTYLYSPIIQVMWVIANWELAPPALFMVRAIGVGVTALTYTFDTRARFGLAFGERIGSTKVVPRLITLYTALVNLLLTTIVVVLLIRGVTTMKAYPLFMKLILAFVYVIFSCLWAFVSFVFLRPRDKGMNEEWFGDGWAGASMTVNLRTCQASFNGSAKKVFLGLFMGAFSGVFVAAPAFIMWQSAKSSEWGVSHGLGGDPKYIGGKNLGEWLKCTTEVTWKKVPQILP